MILFRADANSSIGMGHVMRCLSIADALAANTSYPTIISGKNSIKFVLADKTVAELEKIEMIKMWNKEYCFNYSITATQRKILKAFDLTPANIREQAKLLSAELKTIEETEAKKTAVQ